MVERTLISFPSQLQLMQRLEHLLYLSSSMIFLSGEQGSGKSTLVEQLSNQLSTNTQQVFVTLSEPASAAQVRQQIISQLFMRPLYDAEDTLVNSLQLLGENEDPDIARIIVIDNAKYLPTELLVEFADVIKQKSRFTHNEINFILLAEESSNEKAMEALKRATSSQDIATLMFKLAPLTMNEANQLISHCFAQMGYAPEVQHKDAVAKQLSYCNGLPGKILALAVELGSSEPEVENSVWLKTRLPSFLFLFLLLAILGGLAVYFYPKFINNNVEPEIVVETDVEPVDAIKETVSITEDSSGAQSTEALAGNWSKSVQQPIRDNQLSVGEADNEQRVILSEPQLFELSALENGRNILTSAAVIADQPHIELGSDSESPLPLEHSVDDVHLLDKPVSVVIDAAVPPIRPETPIAPTMDEEADLTQSQLVSPDIEELQNVSLLQQPLNSSLSKQVELLESVEALQVYEIDESIFASKQRLLSIDKNSFTLQLAGMSNKKTLYQFILEYKLPRQDVYVYKTVRNQKPWYVVIYGQFDNRDLAKSAAKNLPDALSRLESWAKEYASVHQELLLNE